MIESIGGLTSGSTGLAISGPVIIKRACSPVIRGVGRLVAKLQSQSLRLSSHERKRLRLASGA
jgi:hypothetical protein